MGEESKVFPHGYGEGLLSAVSVGFFFILVGAIFVTTPDLLDAVLTFFRDFDIVPVPNTQVVLLPAPASPGMHSLVYSAAMKFALVWGFFQIVLLASRFIIPSSASKKTDTASSVIFWLGASYLISISLNQAATLKTWFLFWSQIIILIGVSVLFKAVVLAART